MAEIVWTQSNERQRNGYGRAERYTITHNPNNGLFTCMCRFGGDKTIRYCIDDATAWCHAKEAADETVLYLISKHQFNIGEIANNVHIDRHLSIYRGDEARDKRIARYMEKHTDAVLYTHVVKIIGEWFYQGDVILADQVQILSPATVTRGKKEWDQDTILTWLRSHKTLPEEATPALDRIACSVVCRTSILAEANERNVLNNVLPLIKNSLTLDDMLRYPNMCLLYVPDVIRKQRFSLIEKLCHSLRYTPRETLDLIRRIVEL